MIKRNLYYLKPKKERVEYLLTNYRDIEQIIHTKKQSLALIVSNERAFSRKKNRRELGVTISKTNDFISQTEAEAIEHVQIMESIENGTLCEALIDDSLDAELINMEIFDINLLNNEYNLLRCHMESLPLENKKIFIPYTNRRITIEKLAGKLFIEEESVKQRLYRIRKNLKETVLPYMEEYGRDGE